MLTDTEIRQEESGRVKAFGTGTSNLTGPGALPVPG
jgi:hypothetical protein